MSAAGTLRPGAPERLGRFRLVGRLGEGGQGVVYLGEDEGGPHGRVAVKLLNAGFGQESEARARFMRELETAKRVAEFCTAAILDADVAGCSGRTGRASSTSASPVRWTAPPSPPAGRSAPRRSWPPSSWRGLRAGPAADVFAWAATMVFASSGRLPFAGETMTAIAGRIPHGEPDLGGLAGPLRALAVRCLAKDPATRPDASQVLRTLLGDGHQVPVPPAPHAPAAPYAPAGGPTGADTAPARADRPAAAGRPGRGRRVRGGVTADRYPGAVRGHVDGTGDAERRQGLPGETGAARGRRRGRDAAPPGADHVGGSGAWTPARSR
ncbi:hypothetical protein [Actinomadura mexicana]|uniref:non-specific serine/threonine protein kinase n=1 Tax=Actinomadura mexicana TaxID=134959 RepID=A0A238YUT8_9ACTN|nr:hypothetical protein [Actinomadura mexicana]SNR74558.1 hypothetical protein SAMN06265355_106234 [Actinomadura mexicana]